MCYGPIHCMETRHCHDCSRTSHHPQHHTQITVLKRMFEKAIIAVQQDSSKLTAEAVSSHRTITAFSSQDQILKMLQKAHEGPRKEIVRQSWLAGSWTWISSIAYCFTGTFIAQAASMTSDSAKSVEVVGYLFTILDRCKRIEPDESNGYLAEEVPTLFSNTVRENIPYGTSMSPKSLKQPKLQTHMISLQI
ncbi:hypothetical protein PVK06_046198 [Gossypium arboreum]|uniref:Uncharacterized protein n=1 Tax=Gossypium arboreum TaxID=29729 RepID=A0ABR0M9V9_GOSAR|nr:hypothetical protein PVK06_046198 [Gossypium arboreum]